MVEKVKYKHLDYIQSNGTQYIKTDYTPSDDIKFEITISDIVEVNHTVLFCATNEWAFNRYALVTPSDYTKGLSWLYNSTHTYITTDFTSKHVISLYRVGVKDNTTIVSDNYTKNENLSIDMPLIFFGQDSGINLSSYKFYNLKVYKLGDEDDILIHDFIPVQKESGNQVGILDLKTSKFYTSEIGDNFNLGEVIETIQVQPPDIKDELIELLEAIKEDKDTNLVPENLREGITVLGIDGNLDITGFDNYRRYVYKTEEILGNKFIEALGGDGNVVIDTGIKPNNTTEFELIYTRLATTPKTDYISPIGSKTNKTFIFCDGWGKSYNIKNFDYNTSAYRMNTTQNYLNVKTKIEFKDKVLTITNLSNNTFDTVTITDTEEFEVNNNLVLFGWLQGESIKTFAGQERMLIYSCKIWNNKELVRDYVPMKLGTGELCLYDKVTFTPFLNIATGSFFEGDKLTELEYIQTDNNQYVQTDIVLGGNDWKIELDYEPTVLGYNYNGIWGLSSKTIDYEAWIAGVTQYSRFNTYKPNGLEMTVNKRIIFTDERVDNSTFNTYIDNELQRSYTKARW